MQAKMKLVSLRDVEEGIANARTSADQLAKTTADQHALDLATAEHKRLLLPLQKKLDSLDRTSAATRAGGAPRLPRSPETLHRCNYRGGSTQSHFIYLRVMYTPSAIAARSRCPAAPGFGQSRDFCRPRCTAAPGIGQFRDFCRPRCTAAGFGQPRDFGPLHCPVASGFGDFRGLHRSRCDATSGSYRPCRNQALGCRAPCCHFFSSTHHAAAGPPRILDIHTLVGRGLASPLATPSPTSFHRPR